MSKNLQGAEYMFFSPVVIDGKTGDSIFALESEKTNEELQAAAELYIHKKPSSARSPQADPKILPKRP